jgi:hypothetical protein
MQHSHSNFLEQVLFQIVQKKLQIEAKMKIFGNFFPDNFGQLKTLLFEEFDKEKKLVSESHTPNILFFFKIDLELYFKRKFKNCLELYEQGQLLLHQIKTFLQEIVREFEDKESSRTCSQIFLEVQVINQQIALFENEYRKFFNLFFEKKKTFNERSTFTDEQGQMTPHLGDRQYWSDSKKSYHNKIRHILIKQVSPRKRKRDNHLRNKSANYTTTFNQNWVFFKEKRNFKLASNTDIQIDELTNMAIHTESKEVSVMEKSFPVSPKDSMKFI